MVRQYIPAIKNKTAKYILGFANREPRDFRKMIEGVIKLVKSVMTKID